MSDNETNGHSANTEPCTTKRELIGTGTNLMIHPDGAQSSRIAMFGSHITQTPQVDGAETRTLFTGYEREYAKYMFNVTVEHDCRILNIIDRRAKNGFSNTFGTVLETVVFVECFDEHHTVDCIVIPQYESNHQYFGFELIRTPICNRMRVGDTLTKDTILAETPSVINKEFCYGTQANVILVSHPQVIEDACVISQNLADKLNAWAYKKHRLFIGSKNIPLLPYGTDENPRMYPEVGEKVRPDGILFGTRSYNKLLAAVECSARALRQPCTQFDDCVIVDKEAIVIDINVYRDDLTVAPHEDGADKPHSKMTTPSHMQAMLDSDYNGTSLFHSQIRDFYVRLKRNREKGLNAKQRSDIKYTPKAHQTILNSIAYNPEDLPNGKKENRRKQFNKELMDDYVVEITIKYRIPMAASGKLTDCAGGKGINGETRPDHLMPCDDFGNRVDIMMADNAVLRRTNFNRPFESYICAAARDATEDALKLFDSGKPDEAWDYIIGFCECAAPEWAAKLKQAYGTTKRQHEFVDYLHNNRLRLWIPSDSIKGMGETERDVEANYPPRRSPITFTLADGTKVRTDAKFIVGSMYIMRLDKTGRESFSISAGKYQQFGTIAKQHSADKYRRPIREQPIKFMGESELRHEAAYCPPGTTAELHDRSNNPIVMDEIIKNILTHETPTNIKSAVDRKKFPLGNNRTMLITNHVLACEGEQFTKRSGNITENSPIFKG